VHLASGVEAPVGRHCQKPDRVSVALSVAHSNMHRALSYVAVVGKERVKQLRGSCDFSVARLCKAWQHPFKAINRNHTSNRQDMSQCPFAAVSLAGFRLASAVDNTQGGACMG
jgi:hypothetical protein